MANQLQTLTIDAVVNGGQGLATAPDGKRVFVWNALPGETVQARVIKRRRSYDEAIAEVITTPSPDRRTPLEANYLATSPWQMMDFAAENRFKRDIVRELLAGEHLVVPEMPLTVADDRQWHYRNKMEYSFWGDDDGLHLALHQRGSHGKQIVSGSELALPAVDAAANAVLETLQRLGSRAGDLKTVIVRADQQGNAVAALFVKPQQFPPLELPAAVQGLRVYHSNPKSPASVATELLQEVGDCQLTDQLLKRPLMYDVDSFFQVNLPLFERALGDIRRAIDAPAVTDLYAGVGGIGLTVAQREATLVELHVATAAMAAVNAAASPLQVSVIDTSAEASLDYITSDQPVIVDPPRAGLHAAVANRLLAARPPQLVYLSCNPATQARDLALLTPAYAVTAMTVYNFFPRTPHIEALAVLQRRV